MIADVIRLILGIDFLSALGLVVDGKRRVLLDSNIALQAQGIFARIPYLEISPMTIQSPFSSILDGFPSKTAPRTTLTSTLRDV